LKAVRASIGERMPAVSGGGLVPRRFLAVLTAAVVVAGGLAIRSDSLAGHAPARVAAAPVEQAGDDAARASALARATGRRVAVASERGERHDVYANPDGTFTAELRTQPIRVRRGTGWAAVDTSLMVRPDGSVGPVAVPGEVTFSGGGGQPLVQIREGEHRLALGWPAPLPVPVLAGATATYPEVFPGVDLRLTALPQGFSQVFVVKDRAAGANPALAELPFPVAATGVTLRDDGQGNLGAYDAAGVLVFGSGAPRQWDAVGRSALGRLGLRTASLVLRPDLRQLTDPATRYPVTIDPDFAPGRTGFAMVFSGHPAQAYWGGDGDGVAKVGFCDWPGCNGIGVARSYFVFNGAFLVGRHVLSAEFNIFENWSPSCTPTDLDAYSTRPATSGTTWNSQPQIRTPSLGRRTVAHGWGSGCPGAWVGFNATRAVTDAIADTDGRTGIMLRAGSEGDKYGWKKFNTNPTLAVTYNSYPGTPINQTVENTTCTQAPNDRYVNPFLDNTVPRGPRIGARITDPDGGNLKARFEWHNRGVATPLGTLTTAAKASGSTFTVDIPAAHAADGAKLSVRVRGINELGGSSVDSGPYGAWCDIVIDRTAPGAAPTVASTTYPECAPPDFDPCVSGGGIGRTGAFTLGASGVADVAGFRYDLHDQPATYAAASGGAATVLVTPPEDGPMDLYVRSVDRAGNEGPLRRYHFFVGPGTPPRGQWRLDGITESQAVDDSSSHHDGTVTLGPSTWKVGRVGDALWFNGSSGYVSTTGGPTVHTNMSFTVAAWVKLDRLDTGYRTAVSQDGTRMSGFFLQYNPNSRKWNFMMPASDADAAARRIAESAQPAVAGRWTHLVGSFDMATRQVRIFVDGVAGTVASHPTPWDTNGTVQLGRARSGAVPVDYWPGSLDEVRLYDRLLTPEEVHDLAAAPAVEDLFLPLDGGSGPTALDESGQARSATLGTGTTWTTGRVGTGAVALNGGVAAVATAGPAIRTDASFTVTAWVRLATTGTAWQSVLSQDGSRASGFQLRYRGDTQRWTFALPQADVDAYPVVSVDAPDVAFAGEWTHLAGVYDQAAGRIRLYVNGALVGEVAASATWNATGPFRIGVGRQNGTAHTPMTGDVDDVHAWTGVRTADQIRAEYLAPVTRRITVYTGQLTRFATVDQYHVVTTGPAPAGAHFEASLGIPAPDGAAGTQVLRSCRASANDYLLATDCGAAADLGPVGSVYTTPPAGVETIPVYRCRVPNKDHFASYDPACEGQTTEALLGYTRAYAFLLRHTSSAFPYDEGSATYRLPAQYRLTGNFGVVGMRQYAGTTALYSCQDTSGLFSSTDAACEGATVLRRVGYLWTAAPTGVTASAELFRCRATRGDRFDSRDPTCEGQTVERSLGYVVTQL
jgi:hypothetical protein